MADASKEIDQTGHSTILEKAVVVRQSETSAHHVSPEQQAQLNKLFEEHGSTWDGPNDPHDPYNWSSSRKISVALIVSVGQLITLMSTSMMASALIQIARDLRIDSSTAQISFSIFVLGLAFAPFLIAALSEIYGRKPIWLISNLFYCLWNALCPVGKSTGLMIVGRFLAGSGASVGITLTGPIMADMYRAKDRGKSLAIATFIPYLGPALGPIVGGLLSQHLAWPWLFWVLSIADGVLVLVGFLFIQETYTPVLLERQTAARAEHSRNERGTPRSRDFYRQLFTKLSVSMLRPIRLMIRRPIMQLIAFSMAMNFGIYVLMLSTFATLFIERYHETETIGSLNYIAVAIGSTFSAQVGGHIMDFIYKRSQLRTKGASTPEFRVPYMAPTGIIIPVGLFWYGWSAEKGISWVMVDFGAAILTAGSFMFSQGLLAYMLDEFKHAASANAAARMLSNICGFAFPIFAPALYRQLGYGWGNSLLAFLYLSLVAPVPFILFIWGPKLRIIGRGENE